MTMIAVPDRMTFTAPAPDAVATATVQTVGRRGLATYYYWIVSHFPIGIVVSDPFGIWNAPNTLDASNYVNIVWTGTTGVVQYDILRTLTPVYPSLPGNYALAQGLTVTQFRDQGQTLAPYNIAGLPHGAPVSCLVFLNNRDFEQPVLQLPCRLGVTQLLFPDGSSQTTAGGAAIRIKGTVPDHAALLALPGPHEAGDAYITLDNNHLWVWDGSTWIDTGPAASVSAAGSNGQVQFNNGGLFGASPNLFWNNTNGWLGIRTSTPQTGLTVNDTVFVTGSTSGPTSGAGVEVWYDAAVGTPPGQGGIDAWDFSAGTYKRFFVDGNPLLLNADIGNTGNVGIGTTAPLTNLHIQAPNRTSLLIGNPSEAGTMYLLATTGGGMGLVDLATNAIYSSTGPPWSQIDPVVSSWLLGFRNSPIGAPNPSLFSIRYMEPGDPPAAFPITRLAITGTGNIGVHNDAPECALDVTGAILARTPGSHPFPWPTTGKGIVIWQNPDTASVLPGVGFIQCLDFPAQVTPTTGFLPFHIDGNPLCLNTDGDMVGINTLTPAFQLDVTGDINCTGQFRVNGAPFTATVAVGATSPASPQMGQLWYDNVNFRLFIFLGSWIQV